MTLVTVYDTGYSELHKKPLNSIKFWRKFSEIRVEGYTKFIQFFEPQLSSLSNELKEFKDPTDSQWVRSINEHLTRERAHLSFLKKNRKTYGDMIVNLREHEGRMKANMEELDRQSSALAALKEECLKIQDSMVKDKDKFERKMNKLEDLLYSSSSHKDNDLKEKGKKLQSLGAKYNRLRTQYEAKTTSLIENSNELFVKFDQIERDKLDTVVELWDNTVSTLSDNSKRYTQNVDGTKDWTASVKRIDKEAILEREKSNRSQNMRILSLKSSDMMIEENFTIKEFLASIQKKDEEPTESPNTVHDIEMNPTEEQKETESEEQKQTKSKPTEVRETSTISGKGKGKGKGKVKAKKDDVTYVTQLTKEDLTSDEELGSMKPDDEKPSTSGYKGRPLSPPPVIHELSSSEDEEPVRKPPSPVKRPLPVPPTKCWDGSSPSTSGQRSPVTSSTRRQRDATPLQHVDTANQEDEFKSFKTKIKRSYKKERENEISVKKGEKVKILSRPENGFVLAKKKSLLVNRKEGYIPQWAI